MTSDIDVTKYTIEASECEIKKIIPEVNLKLKFKPFCSKRLLNFEIQPPYIDMLLVLCNQLLLSIQMYLESLPTSSSDINTRMM